MQEQTDSRPSHHSKLLLNSEARVRDVIPLPLFDSAFRLCQSFDRVWTGTAIACTLSAIPATVSLERR